MIVISTENAVLVLLSMIGLGLLATMAIEGISGWLRETALNTTGPFLGWIAAGMTGIVAVLLWDFFAHVRIEWLP